MSDNVNNTTIPISDLNEFVTRLISWHTHKVEILEHLKSIPENSGVQQDDGKEIPLTGDLHKGFLLGLHVALCELGTLPFAIEYDNESPNKLN